MQIPELTEKQEAGLICYYDENTWVSCGIIQEADGYYIQVKEHVGEENRVHGKTKLPTDMIPQQHKFTFRVETAYLERTFNCEYEYQGEKISCQVAHLDNVYYLCDEGLKKGKRFTGAMVGMYAYAGMKEYAGMYAYAGMGDNTEVHKMEAEFSLFTYKSK